MEIEFLNNSAIIKNADEFSPEHIFLCGQAFRFDKVDENTFEGVAYGRYLRVCASEGTITLYPTTKEDFSQIWEEYFDFSRDYNSLFGDCDDKMLLYGKEHAKGLRVLNQQPFETLISFIISANNNVVRIRKIIKNLCEKFGKPFVFEDKKYYAFPTKESLANATIEELTECGAGYRAPYIKETALSMCNGFMLQELASLPYELAKKQLSTLKGVGPKVADCVLLFSLHKKEAFPADVWIKRVLKEAYGFTGSDKEVFAFARGKFGECAGIAQQYLFYYAKENSLGKNKE